MITPSDTPSSPLYAGVTPHGQGAAPYDIQADPGDLSSVFNGANDAAGAGFLYPMSDRQRESEAVLQSPQGFGAFQILSGYSGGGGEDWPSDVRPGDVHPSAM